MFQVISAAELARLQASNPIPSLGVMYQIRSTGDCYVWGPDTSTLDSPGAVSGGGVSAPSTLDSTSATYNGGTLKVAAAGTITVAAGATAALPGGVVLQVARTGSATLAFSGGAVKENASGTSSTSVTLAASGVYSLLPGDSTDTWRLNGGAST